MYVRYGHNQGEMKSRARVEAREGEAEIDGEFPEFICRAPSFALYPRPHPESHAATPSHFERAF